MRRTRPLGALAALLLLSPVFAQDIQPQTGFELPMDLDTPREAAPPPEALRVENPVAVFSGLDKITGRITSFDVYVNETVQFGALQVTPRVCYSAAPEASPRTDAFIEVDEITLDREIRRIFTGWMFADSPGLNAVEHPIYDVWLQDCRAESSVPAPPSN